MSSKKSRKRKNKSHPRKPADAPSKPSSQSFQVKTQQKKTVVAFFLILGALFTFIALTSGIGGPRLPAGDIVFVEDVPGGGGITLDQYKSVFEQSWRRAGLPQAPERSDEQYQSIQDAALADLLDQLWLRGEAASLGVSASSREIQNELDTIRETQFKNKQDYQKFLRDSGFTPSEVRDRVRLQILSRKIEERVRSNTPEPSEAEVQRFYDASLQQYTTPEERRFILISTSNNKDATKIEQSIQKDDTKENFSRLAKLYSDDPSSSQGGRASTLQASYPGEIQAAIDQAAKSTTAGPLQAEVDGKEKIYFFRLEEIIPEKVEPLDAVRTEIVEQISQTKEQETVESFIEDYQSLWTSRTVCADGFVISRCSNYKAPALNTDADPACYNKEAFEKAKEPLSCPAPVISRGIRNPGTTDTDPFGNPLQEALPQGPVLPAGTPPEAPPS